MITIGIPTWRRAEMTKRAIDSVLAQAYPGAIEVCVYVDGPDDATRDMLKALVHSFTFRSDLRANRTLVWEAGDENRGIAHAKNRALTMGRGQYRGILDSDDYYEPGFVAACVAELDAHLEVVAVYTDNYTQTPHRKVLTEAADWSIEALLRCQLRGDCYLARGDVLKRTGLHDERFELEVDYDLFYALAEQGPLRRIAKPLQTVTEHGGRTTADRTRAAYWHAVGLGKWGHPAKWAEMRAARNPEWLDAIREGYAQGSRWRKEAARAVR